MNEFWYGFRFILTVPWKAISDPGFWGIVCGLVLACGVFLVAIGTVVSLVESRRAKRQPKQEGEAG